MNAVDIVIVLILIFGALVGLKRGIIKSVVSFIGLIIVFGLAFYFKNALSEFLYTHLPFFKFTGDFANLSLINIIIYEIIAFLILVIIFGTVLKLVLVVTGIVEKVLDLTVVLGFVSRLLGLVFGLIETYIILFIVLFILNSIPLTNQYIEDSYLSERILNSTPVLSKSFINENNAINEFSDLAKECNDTNSYECNIKSLDILLKYGVLKPESAEKLINEGKININGALDIVKNYEGGNENA
jgi:uncharacterized membrane protein required for colicin V production